MARTSLKASVTFEKQFQISIPDERLTKEALAEFSQSICNVETKEGLFKYVASQLVRYGEHFIEGIGMFTEGEGYEESFSFKVLFEEVDVYLY